MPRNPTGPSLMEILLLTALARAPMHGYELKLELRYKHVRWWAKCEHGHLYAALARLERNRFIRPVRRSGGRANQRVFAITAAGRRRVEAALETLGRRADETYFDLDMFLSSCHLLDREHVLAILGERRDATAMRAREARALVVSMRAHVPAQGHLIMAHRLEHLDREVEFLDRCVSAFREVPRWGAFLEDRSIAEFIRSQGVPLEDADVRSS